jgi:hypothetical protein
MLTWKVEFTARGTFKLIHLQWKKGHAINTRRPFLHEMAIKNNNHSINYKILSLLQARRQLHPPIFWGYPRKNVLDSTLQEPRCLDT